MNLINNPLKMYQNILQKDYNVPDTIDSFTGEFFFLSNFYICNIEVEEISEIPDSSNRIQTVVRRNYKSVEHAYQAMKSDDYETRKKIACCKTPGEAKRMGRQIILSPDWDKLKYSIMQSLITLKFLQNIELKHKLILTKNFELIEGNTWGDTYWGVCNGVGENNLGKILMAVRDRLINNEPAF